MVTKNARSRSASSLALNCKMCICQDLCLETPKLAFGSIYLVARNGDYQNFSVAKDGKESNITRALGCLFDIQFLQMQAEFNAYLAMGVIPKKLPLIFHYLKDIHMLVDA